MLTIVVALKLWGLMLVNKKVVINCDNMVSVRVLNTGASRNSFLQRGVEIPAIHPPSTSTDNISSGLENFSDNIMETPLYNCKNVFHHNKSIFRSRGMQNVGCTR
jgi:hypothetical protein